MRVVTTWMYFDAKDVEGFEARRERRPRGRGEEPEPGIGFAWFAGDTTMLDDIDNLKLFRRIPRAPADDSLSERVLRQSLDIFLVDGEQFDFDRPGRGIGNPLVVDYLLEQPIVIERSPPLTVTLSGLLTKTNLPVWIGTYAGWSIAPEHSVLLLITIPGGIIIVSSAIGLADALAAGLSKSVKRLFHIPLGRQLSETPLTPQVEHSSKSGSSAPTRAGGRRSPRSRPAK